MKVRTGAFQWLQHAERLFDSGLSMFARKTRKTVLLDCASATFINTGLQAGDSPIMRRLQPFQRLRSKSLMKT
jgi:hypothetical protein